MYVLQTLSHANDHMVTPFFNALLGVSAVLVLIPFVATYVSGCMHV